MNKIEFFHNPFTLETKFFWNDAVLEDRSELTSISEQRLQQWIEKFFPMVKEEIFGGESKFEVIFHGVEADCLDVEQAAQEAENKHGMEIKLTCQPSRNGEVRLAEIQSLMEEIKNHPLFKEKINKDNEIQKGFDAAFDKDFDAYIVATMSSGKSTFINAMLGCDVLPAMNEATTATIARITDNDQKPDGQYSVKQINHEGDEVDSCELNFSSRDNAEKAHKLMKEWNADPQTLRIGVEGKIVGVKEREEVRLVLSDTPGPNNSQNEAHGLTTMRYLQDDDRSPVILYVLNGEQLGINDDSRLLREIAEIMKKGGKQSKDRFIFILNKADKFDPEKGELISGVLARAKTYLEHNGIENPRIYPVSAYLASLFRKRALNPDLLTRKERSDLTAMEDLFSEEDAMDLVQYMSLTKTARETLEKREMNLALKRSGLPAIEEMIDEYIVKYSLPYRVERAYKALCKVIQVSSGEEEFNALLNDNQRVIDEAQAAINKLGDHEKLGYKINLKIKDLISEEVGISQEAVSELHEQGAAVQKMIGEFDRKFIGRGRRDKADRLLTQLEEIIQFKYNFMIVRLDKILDASQENTRNNLAAAFSDCIREFFGEEFDISLPILAGLETQILALESSVFSLAENEVKINTIKEHVGSHEVSDSTWWNPFSWGRTKTVQDYKDRQVEEVDLEEIWQERSIKIEGEFNNLFKNAQARMQENAKSLIEVYAEKVKSELTNKLKEIQEKLDAAKLTQSNKDEENKEIEARLAQIEAFKEKLNAILEL